jgi:hypothetical protein
MGIIEETSFAYGYRDFERASDQEKFEVYKLTLSEVFKALSNNLAREFLEEIQDSLEAMESGFYDLINRTFQDWDLTKVLPILIEARSYLSSALWAEDNYGRNPDFFKYLGFCRMKINELIQHLS